MSNGPAPVRFALAGILLMAAFALWTASTTADDLARRHERMATFRDSEAGTSQDSRRWSAWLRTMLDREAAHGAAARDYWRGRYDAFVASDGERNERDDSASQLIAANAAFRHVQRAAASRALSVDELDRALQAYAAVLKNVGFERDAAWNYEFVARLRDAAAREKPGGRQAAGKPASPTGSDPSGAIGAPHPAFADPSGLPSGPTIHGRPGMHPPSTKGEQFEVITPMDYGDREAQPEPTPGVKLPRKG